MILFAKVMMMMMRLMMMRWARDDDDDDDCDDGDHDDGGHDEGCEGGMWFIPVMVFCCLFVVVVVGVVCGSFQLWCFASWS